MYYSVDCGVFLNLTIQPAWLKTVIDVFFELLCLVGFLTGLAFHFLKYMHK